MTSKCTRSDHGLDLMEPDSVPLALMLFFAAFAVRCSALKLMQPRTVPSQSCSALKLMQPRIALSQTSCLCPGQHRPPLQSWAASAGHAA